MKKIYFLFLLSILFFLLWFFDIAMYLSIDNLIRYFEQLKALYIEFPIVFMIGYFFFYIVVAALPVPGEMTTTLLGGAIMGFLPAILLVSVGSTVGATIAMLTSRYVFRDFFARRFSKVCNTIQRGFAEDGIYYVFMLRLIPVPFFIVNIALGLTSVSIPSFFILSQIGMFPATMLVAKAGEELGLIEQVTDIFSPTIVILLCLIGILPLVMKKIFIFFRKKDIEDLSL